MNKVQYYKILNNTQLIKLPQEIKKNALGALSKSPPITLAPLNTDIRLGDINVYKITPNIVGVMAERPPPPETYFLNKDHKNGKLIELPRNQYSCGSCWAISAATIVGDCFVVKGIVDYSPNLSTTYILSTYPQNKCGGGVQVKVYDDLKVGGLPSQHCVDYEWCINNNVCNPGDPSASKKAGKEFSNAKQAMEYLNSQIPKSGCYFPDNKKLYFIKDVENITPENPNDNSQLITFRNLAKYHIMEEGPISAGYLVYDNFIQGYKNNFELTKGIYFENVDYAANSLVPTRQFQMVGGHAVAVVGWGIEKNIKYSPNKTEDVPYWYVRNSWGDKLADKGYFKIAMYPYNKSVAFDIPIDMSDGKGNTEKLGGFVLVKADRIEESKITKQIPLNNTKNINEINFYKTENSDNIKSSLTKSKSTDYILYIFLVIIGIIILIAIYYLIKSFTTKSVILTDISNLPGKLLTEKIESRLPPVSIEPVITEKHSTKYPLLKKPIIRVNDQFGKNKYVYSFEDEWILNDYN